VVQGAGKGEVSLLKRVKNYLMERDKKDREPFLGVIHRLDKPVSGVVIFAKNSRSAKKMSELFKAKKVEKIYLARIKGRIKGEGVWNDWFWWNDVKRKAILYSNQKEGTKRAITFYKEVKPGIVLLSPITGRKHQLRAALSKRGCPIVGDTKYGAKGRFSGKILLHHLLVSFEHPYLKERVEVFAELPDYFSVENLDKRLVLEFSYKVLKLKENLELDF